MGAVKLLISNSESTRMPWEIQQQERILATAPTRKRLSVSGQEKKSHVN